MPNVKQRRCVACMQDHNGSDMIRIVRTREDEAEFDAGGKMPGRGAYICRNAQCVKKALQQGRIFKSLKIRPMEGAADALLERIAKEIEGFEE